MAKNISVELSVSGINKAIKELKKYKKELKKKVNHLIDVMLETGEDYAINELGHVDTGDTLNSIYGYRKGSHGVIVAGGNAIWIEFGTGVYYNKSEGGSPHPKGQELGMTIGGYGNHNGMKDGWFYPTEDPRYEIKNSGYAYTHGIKSNAFMYRTAQELRRQLPELAKRVFDE